MKTVVVGSDLHFTAHSPYYILKFIQFIASKKPDCIVINGDMYDMYSFSRYPRNVNLFTPETEVRKSRSLAEKLFSDIKKASPKSKIFLTRGNHSERLGKRISEKLPELIGIFKFEELWLFDNVETIMDTRQTLTIDDAIYVHGWSTNLGDHAKYFLKNVFTGHSHRLGLYYHRLNNKTIFECNSGHLANLNTKQLGYTPSKVTRWTAGFAYRDHLGYPQIIHL